MTSPFVIVIFGATGDLAQHKLLPALYSLYKNNLLGDKFYIVGFARREFSDEEYRQMISSELHKGNESEWKEFEKNVYYQQGMFDEERGYNDLIKKLNGFDNEIGACITRLFYLATPPDNYETILTYLESTKLSEGCGQGSEKWTRLAIEKPFGKDLDTARHLDMRLAKIFEERQIYRVDHYLGKETMQNMIAFRFANSIFEPIWNKEHIDHIQITWAEAEGVRTHGRTFDGLGMLRDVGQNHLLQMLATVAMEQPKDFSKEEVREARANAIKAIRCPKDEEVKDLVVRGQYNDYRSEKNVDPDSQSETFFAAKLYVDTPRFSDVPFYIRAGKKMEEEKMEIKVVFKQTCHILFKEYGCPEVGNVLTIRIQPDEGITLRVIAKKPGNTLSLDTVDMKFSYHQSFGGRGADAYEKILLDILMGDQMLFNRSDELDSSWHLISTILHAWEKDREDISTYESGGTGPDAANALIEKDGRKWL
ncbi:MAG TPA: glucose-6-phosphate dehydrogenase [Candidatus Saccharimonadales bacterium]|nr:glucose-6-phosphate dehydrogenase [Candidatus Saccharimonadales bacterium]